MTTNHDALRFAASLEKGAAELRLYDSAQSNNYAMCARMIRDLVEKNEALAASKSAENDTLRDALWIATTLPHNQDKPLDQIRREARALFGDAVDEALAASKPEPQDDLNELGLHPAIESAVRDFSNTEPQAQAEQEIHSCSPFCTRPECVAEREASKPQAQAADPEVVKQQFQLSSGTWVDFENAEHFKRVKESGAWPVRELITMQSHREAIAKKDAALNTCVEAMEDGASVCGSISISRNRRIVRDGCTLYAQTEEWCKWAEEEIGPKLIATITQAQEAQR